jgi:hypothetical protein
MRRVAVRPLPLLAIATVAISQERDFSKVEVKAERSRGSSTLLRDCVGLVDAAITQNKSLEQMQKEQVLQKDDAVGQGFAKTSEFVELIYNELHGPPQRTRQGDGHHH